MYLKYKTILYRSVPISGAMLVLKCSLNLHFFSLSVRDMVHLTTSTMPLNVYTDFKYEIFVTILCDICLTNPTALNSLVESTDLLKFCS